MISARDRRLPLTALAALFLVSGCGDGASGTDSPLETVADADQDGIIDVHEGDGDADGDGQPSALDTDSDGDLIPDAVEAGDTDPFTFPRDSDGDGKADYLDPDSDDNGVPDQYEAGLNPFEPADSDRDALADYIDPDNDGDRISDVIEIGGSLAIDTDGDGIADYYDLDSDDDDIADADEAGGITIGRRPADTDGDGRPDYRDLDADGDGISDRDEAGDMDVRTPPRDTDGDGVGDFADLDADGDSLSDKDELALKSEPYLYDSDGDGASDGVEQMASSDPRNEASLPGVGWVEVPQRGQAQAPFSFTLAIGRADVVFLLDNTGSMGWVLDSLAEDFTDVVGELARRIPDIAFGVGTFQDYEGMAYGGGGVLPHVMVQQVTTDIARVQTALNGLKASGGSGPTSAFESLFQALSGRGFDQDCDGRLDDRVDVPPFMTTATDAFGGAVAGSYDSTDPSTGVLGGMGFRNFSLPVLIYSSDTSPRDPDDGDLVPSACASPSSSSPASESRVVAEAMAAGARLIAVNVSGDAQFQSEAEKLAIETGSLGDVDGNHVSDDPLVYKLGASTSISDAIIEGVTSIATTGEFDTVEVVADGDPWGFVAGTSPSSYSRVKPGQTLEFDISFMGAMPAAADDQLFQIGLSLVGDQATRLGYLNLIVVVPGERR